MSTTWNRSLRGLSLSLCLVMVVAPVLRAEAMAANTGMVRASVTDSVTKSPVELITVRVVNLDTAEQVAMATTDEAGSVLLPELPFGTYHVSAVAPEGFVAGAGPLVTVNAEAVAPEVAIVLAPAQEQEGQEGDPPQEEDCEEDDEECLAAAAAAAGAGAGGGIGTTGLILLGVVGAGAIALGISQFSQQEGDDDVITQ